MKDATLLICTPCHHLHGGVERIIENLHEGLPDYGFRVVVGLAARARFHLPERFRAEYPALQTVEFDGVGTRLGPRAPCSACCVKCGPTWC